MPKTRVVTTNNLGSIDLTEFLVCKNELCITATRSMKYANKKTKGVNVVDVTELQQQLREQVRELNRLRESEQRYILHNTINELPDNELRQSLLLCLPQLYELFASLLLADVNPEQINLAEIKKTQIKSNAQVFNLYIAFHNNLAKQGAATYQEGMRHAITILISEYEKVSLLGFAFFDDLQSALFREIVAQNKLTSIFVGDDKFLLDDWLAPLLDRHGIEFATENKQFPSINNFDELRLGIFDTTPLGKSFDESLDLIEPFPNREAEFKFILSAVIGKVKHLTTKEEIQSELDKFAIVLTHDFRRNSAVFNEILSKQGIFISDNQSEEENQERRKNGCYRKPDYPGNKVYTSRQDFLDDCNFCSFEFSYETAIKRFNSFPRLELYQSPRTLFNTPLGKYIHEIYKISANGMNAESFNTMLSTNWLFASQNEMSLISEFKLIESFFTTRQTPGEWEKQIDNLLKIKRRIQKDEAYSAHPLAVIEKSSLEHFKKHISFVNQVITHIQDVNARLKVHILTLIKAAKKAGINKELEEQLLNTFTTIINKVETGISMEHAYFAKNFQALINEYMINQQEKTDNMRLHTINLESVSNYEIVYLPMFEIDKYPFGTDYSFPYTKSIAKILKDENLVKGYEFSPIRERSYNYQFANYKFRNLFKIAKEKIVFTRIDKNGDMHIDMSIYGKDLLRKTGIKQKPNGTTKEIAQRQTHEPIQRPVKIKGLRLNQLLLKNVRPKLLHYLVNNPGKLAYTDKFLLTFYARALIAHKFYIAIADNKEKDLAQLKGEIPKVFDEVCEEVFANFPLFDETNKFDLRITARKQVNDFVHRNFFTGQFKPKGKFTLSLGKEHEVQHKGITIRTWRNLVLCDLEKNECHEFDISRALDYLTASAKGFKTAKKRYHELMTELKDGPEGLDKFNIINFASFKINTQLSGKYKDQGDDNGIQRVQGLVDELSDFQFTNSDNCHKGSCMYCILKDICMGEVDDD